MIRIVTYDGMSGVLKAKSGDRYMVRLAVLNGSGDESLIDVYFASPLHLPPLSMVDASPDEPNPPSWEDEYG